MKLARVLATDRAKVSRPAAPQVEPAQARSSSDFQLNGKVCCGSCRSGGTTASTSKEEHWSCGVCYEEVCCPFSLPCGHTVCGNCLQQLLGRQATCPFCRVSVFRGCVFGRNVAIPAGQRTFFTGQKEQLIIVASQCDNMSSNQKAFHYSF
ncbi:hypothetical protein WJX79_006568 [Trebouxia sp. C0005]